MSPFLRYTTARLAIFAVVAAALLLVPIPIDPLLKLMVALLVSAVLAYFLLGRLRAQVGEQVAGLAERRAQRKERLRSALAGDDDRSNGESDRSA
jgi:Protein of unknown function (DUF4229)